MGEPFVPNDNQLAGIRFGLQKSYGAFFWDPGTRKTSTLLFIYKLLRDEGLINRMLVLSEVNVVDDVWPAEIERWDDLDVTYSRVRGSERKRAAAMDLDADIYLLNNENLEWFVRNYRKGFDIDMLFVDESSKYRNRGTTRFRMLRKLLPKFKRRYVGTGTPTPKGYMNLWPQMYIVDRGESLGVTLGQYRLRYFRPGGFKGKEWVLRDGAEVEIQEAISHRVHRVEKHMDVTIEFEDVMVDLPSRAMRAYREMEREFIAEWRDRKLTAMNAATATQKLRQMANGAVYTNDGSEWLEIHRAKIEALKRLIAQLGGKSLLVAYEFDHDYRMMQKYGIRMPSYTEAKVKDGSRTALKDAWNRGELPLLSGNIAGMAHGLNIQRGGHHLVYYGLTFNFEDYEQLYQRLWRDGQTRDVTAFRLAARGTVDETMLRVLHVRGSDMKTLLDALRERMFR